MPSERQAISTDHAPTPTGPFSQAVRIGDLIFTAGQAGRNRATGVMGDLADQTSWALDNLDQVLQAAGTTLGHTVKATVFVKESTDTAPLNDVWSERFAEPRPARSTVFVSHLKNPEMLIEVEVVAVMP